MKTVFLDKNSLDKNDLDFSRFKKLEIDWIEYDSTSAEETMEKVRDAEIIVSNKVVINQEIINHATGLKLICVAATGVNNIDLEAAKSRGIRVCNVRAYGNQSVVQHVFTLLLMLMRNIPRYQQAVKNGDWAKSKEFCLLDYPIEDLTGKVLGIVGFGELGKTLARMADAFGMKVVVAQHGKQPGKIDGMDITFKPFEQMLGEVDVLSLHVPLTEETRNMISTEEINQMKNTAILVNMARGGIVDEVALRDALIENRLGGAAIDVLEKEPPESSSPLLDINLPNLIVTPHIAWASRTARQNLLNQVAENIQKFLSDDPQNIVV